MLKKMFFSLLIVVMVSCSSTKSSTLTAKHMDVYGAGVMHIPVVADLEVKEGKVTGVAQAKSSETLLDGGKVLKTRAIANAIEVSGADVIIEPSFKSVTEKGLTTVKVTGFPAKYKNFRSATKLDKEVMEIGLLQKSEKSSPTLVKKSKRGKGVLAVLGGLALAGLALFAVGAI